MAENLNWKLILKEKASIDSLKIANSNEVAAKKIYQAIKDDEDIPDNLKLIYKEAVCGSNEKVKGRVRNRIGNIRRHLK